MKASATKADVGKGSKSAQKNAKHDIRSRASPLNETGPLNDLVQRLSQGDGGSTIESLAKEFASMPLTRRQSAARSMQRTLGNRFVQRLAIQAKLRVGPAGDRYEREADRVADHVMRMTEPSTVQRQEDEDEIQTKSLAASITPLVQRFTSFITSPLQREAEKEEEIQTKSAQAAGSFEAVSAFGSRLSAVQQKWNQFRRSNRGVLIRQMNYAGTIQRVKTKRPPNISEMLAKSRFHLKPRIIPFKRWKQGYEAQHIIPWAVAEKLNMPLSRINEAWNGMMLPSGRKSARPIVFKAGPMQKGTNRPRHILRGLAHPIYNKVVEAWIIYKFGKLAIWSLEKMKTIAQAIRQAVKKLGPSKGVDDLKRQMIDAEYANLPPV